MQTEIGTRDLFRRMRPINDRMFIAIRARRPCCAVAPARRPPVIPNGEPIIM
jgi:hypothetical protein